MNLHLAVTIKRQIESKKDLREITVLRNRWNLNAYQDPNYNPNLSYLSEQLWYGIREKLSQ